MTARLIGLLAAVILCAGPAPAETQPPARTLVKDRAALERLIGNSGVTLQWIGWGKRGDLTVDYGDGLLRLSGGQTGSQAGSQAGRGELTLDGIVTEIGKDYFTFVGRIDISDTPDAGRDCQRNGEMTFRVTQKRRYWRLQQMEVCDGLTDYVDIYF